MAKNTTKVDCPYCRRRLVKSLKENDKPTKITNVSYSMLCSPRKDGDGKKLAAGLKERLTMTLAKFAIDMNVTLDEMINMTSCRYRSDGEIKVRIKVSNPLVKYLTSYLYTKQDDLEIDILEAGKD